jgi:hypothetical protein
LFDRRRRMPGKSHFCFSHAVHPLLWLVIYAAATGSISVGSSSGARELLTRFDTGQRCSFWLC